MRRKIADAGYYEEEEEEEEEEGKEGKEGTEPALKTLINKV